MEKIFSWGKIFFSLILAFFLTSFSVRYVFFPQAAVFRPSFKETVTNLPQKLASLISRARPSFGAPSLPPPWILPPDSQPTSYQPKPTTYKPLPTSYQPPASPTMGRGPTVVQPTVSQPTTVQPTATPLPAAGSLTQQEQETVNLINQRRAEMGLGTLSLDFQLVTAARKHSQDMAEHNFCGHEGSDGSDPFTRVRAAGYNGRVYGETVGCGYRSAQAVVDGWWGSAGHKAILTKSKITVIGVGWWTNPYRQTAVVGY